MKGKLKKFFLLGTIPLAILIVFGQAFKFPFIQDDWSRLHLFTFSQIEKNLGVVIINLFRPHGQLFYRPFTTLYFALAYLLFKLNPLGYHILAFLTHLATSLVAVYLVKRLTHCFLFSFFAGLLYATSFNVHLEPLLWVVGNYNLVSIFLAFLCLFFFLKEKYPLSAITLLLSILWRESTIFLPFLLMLYLILYKKSHLRFSKLWCFLPLLIIYILIRLLAFSPFALPESHPYKMKLLGWHLPVNFILYLLWGIDDLLPLKGLLPGKKIEHFFFLKNHYLFTSLILLFLFLLIASLAFFFLRGKKSEANLRVRKQFFFWGGWFFLGLVPIIFLPNHTYHYYFTGSLLPFIVLFLLMVKTVILKLGGRIATFYLIISLLSGTNIWAGFYYFYQENKKGVSQEFIMGTNSLIKRGNTVKIVQNYLLKNHPFLPDEAVLIFENVDLSSFRTHCGPQVWYKNLSLKIYDLHSLIKKPDGIYLRMGHEVKKIPLDPEKTFVFKLLPEGRLIENKNWLPPKL
jgi:hypothetical protein